VHYVFAAIGVAWVAIGGGLLVWSARHYEDLHGPLRSGQSPVHPTAARLVGVGTIAFTAASFLLALVIVW
jgi:hypothetical protein